MGNVNNLISDLNSYKKSFLVNIKGKAAPNFT